MHEHVDDRVYIRVAQQRNQRLGQDGIADPRRRHDQNAFASHERRVGRG
jgi:hypothetical protein